jgi:hypothetical protein
MTKVKNLTMRSFFFFEIIFVENKDFEENYQKNSVLIRYTSLSTMKDSKNDQF